MTTTSITQCIGPMVWNPTLPFPSVYTISAKSFMQVKIKWVFFFNDFMNSQILCTYTYESWFKPVEGWWIKSTRNLSISSNHICMHLFHTHIPQILVMLDMQGLDMAFPIVWMIFCVPHRKHPMGYRLLRPNLKFLGFVSNVKIDHEIQSLV